MTNCLTEQHRGLMAREELSPTGIEVIGRDPLISLDLVWMCMYSSQSTCVKVDWSEIKLCSIPFHSNICGLKWIHMHPNKALDG